MIIIDGIAKRNIQEQVCKNQQDIKDLQRGAVVSSSFVFKIVGKVDSVEDLPEEYEGDLGDAFEVGTAAPYNLYLWTKLYAHQEEAVWFNLGQFPLPGPQGVPGERGETGQTGATGNGIASITLLTTEDLVKTYRITYTNGSHFDFNVSDGEPGADGDDGEPGNGIVSVELLSETATAKTYRMTFTDETHFDYSLLNGTKGDTGETGPAGSPGEAGNGIVGITLISTVGLQKTYRITFTNGDHFDYVVSDGSAGAIDVDALKLILEGSDYISVDYNTEQTKLIVELDETKLETEAPTEDSTDLITSGAVYNAIADIDVPVQSVNTKTGAVVLSADDILADNASSVQDNLERIDGEINRVEAELTEEISSKLDASKQAVSDVGGLVVPSSTPSSRKIVSINTSNAQELIDIGEGLFFGNGGILKCLIKDNRFETEINGEFYGDTGPNVRAVLFGSEEEIYINEDESTAYAYGPFILMDESYSIELNGNPDGLLCIEVSLTLSGMQTGILCIPLYDGASVNIFAN